MIYHTYSAYYPSNRETRRRMDLAKLTWSLQPWEEVPVQDSQCRLLVDEFGKMPYIKDIIGVASKGKPSSDIIVLTNSDICVANNCSIKIASALQGASALYCFRKDFGRLSRPVADKDIFRGRAYAGSDLYAFRISWWNINARYFPDMVIGREAWDAILRLLMDRTNQGCIPDVPNLIYHESHPNTWENPRNRHRIKGQLHNQSLARRWLASAGIHPRIIGL